MARYTPMMEQYMEIKNQYKDCLLLFRLGDFYEFFFEDAVTASRELDIVLTGRDCGAPERAPMCGVPYHSVDGYIARLIEKGYKAAICEQTEDPRFTKTIVKREVVRIITPGTVTDQAMLDEGKNNYIACVCGDKSGCSLAACDVTTGEFVVTTIPAGGKIEDELIRLNPAELIVNEGFSNPFLIENAIKAKPARYHAWAFYPSNAKKRLTGHFRVASMQGYGMDDGGTETSAAGALLEYLYDTQKNGLSHITTIKKYSRDNYMALDAASRRNLELTETIRDKGKKNSLLGVLDKTLTAAGARTLRKWVEQPLISPAPINRRLDAVGELKDQPLVREELKELLNTVFDIERIMTRIVYGTCGARDLCALKSSVRYFPHIKNLAGELRSDLFTEIHKNFDTLEDIYGEIDAALNEDPPFGVREGGMIRSGFNGELDKLRDARANGSKWLAELEAKERDLSGIKSLKVKYNKVFGYHIEITNSFTHMAPERYVRRQTLANCERYVTGELKEIEDTILGAEERINDLEYELFTKLRERVAGNVERIQLSAYMAGVLDAVQSLAESADKYGYVKPVVNNGDLIRIKAGRHPVVERTSEQGFVPNDTEMDGGDNRLAVVTGPNMAGKSTYMRQVALIVLMAQTGSFVPASNAEIGAVDRIFTRVGASDDLASGQSTFMVEMTEVANILNNATRKSLVILDEIGRGTSTYDGLSIAWSVMEHIAGNIGAKTLFATHYHELTELEGTTPGVKNYNFAVSEQGEDVVFLRRITRGGADRSYGIHVARLAGLPQNVLDRSGEILASLKGR